MKKNNYNIIILILIFIILIILLFVLYKNNYIENFKETPLSCANKPYNYGLSTTTGAKNYLEFEKDAKKKYEECVDRKDLEGAEITYFLQGLYDGPTKESIKKNNIKKKDIENLISKKLDGNLWDVDFDD